MSRARDNANLGAQAGSGLDASDITSGALPVGVTGGSGLNALSASNLSAGTVPDARFPATLPAASGANLTALPAANLSGTITSGTQDAITRLGTVTTGTMNNTIGSSATFPSGHQVKQTFFGDIVSGYVTCNSTSFTDSGIEVQHTTKLSSANSYLIYEFYGGMFAKIADESPQLQVTMRTASNSTYEADERISRNTYGAWYHNDSETYTYKSTYFRIFCGLVSEMGMPTTKSSWAAGDTLYFRLFGLRTGSSDFHVVHSGSTWNTTVTEVTR